MYLVCYDANDNKKKEKKKNECNLFKTKQKGKHAVEIHIKMHCTMLTGHIVSLLMF